MILLWFVLSLSGILIAGCASAPSPKAAPVIYAHGDREQYPPISVDLKQLSRELSEECKKFSDQSLLNDCFTDRLDLFDFYEAFKGAEAFANVEIARRDADYQLWVSTAAFTAATGKGLATAVVSGVTQGLVEYAEMYTLKAEILLTWRGQLLHRGDYEFPLKQYGPNFVGRDSAGEKRLVAAEVVAAYLEDVAAADAFSVGHLHRTLVSNNYLDDLPMPESLGDYALEGRRIFRDPLLGVMVRYQHERFLLSAIDVFVYPVPESRCNDDVNLLMREAESVRRQLQYLEEQGEFRDLDAGLPQLAEFARAEGKIAAVAFRGTWVEPTGVRQESHTHIFCVKDKYLKFRATLDPGDDVREVHEFVASAIAQIDPPDESPFMATFREGLARSTSEDPGEGR